MSLFSFSSLFLLSHLCFFFLIFVSSFSSLFLLSHLSVLTPTFCPGFLVELEETLDAYLSLLYKASNAAIVAAARATEETANAVIEVINLINESDESATMAEKVSFFEAAAKFGESNSVGNELAFAMSTKGT